MNFIRFFVALLSQSAKTPGSTSYKVSCCFLTINGMETRPLWVSFILPGAFFESAGDGGDEFFEREGVATPTCFRHSMLHRLHISLENLYNSDEQAAAQQ